MTGIKGKSGRPKGTTGIKWKPERNYKYKSLFSGKGIHSLQYQKELIAYKFLKKNNLLRYIKKDSTRVDELLENENLKAIAYLKEKSISDLIDEIMKRYVNSIKEVLD